MLQLYNLHTKTNIVNLDINFLNFMPSFNMSDLYLPPIWDFQNCSPNFSMPFFNFNLGNLPFPSVFNFGFSNSIDIFHCSTPTGATNKPHNNKKVSTTSSTTISNPQVKPIISNNRAYTQRVANLATSYVEQVNTRKEGNRLFSNGQNRMWCSDFVGSVINDIYGDKAKGFPRMGCVEGIWNWGQKQNCNLTTYGMNNKQKSTFIAQNIKPGDIMINRTWYDKNSKGVKFNKPKHIFSHTEIVTEVYSDGSFKTVSGGGNSVRYVTHKPSEENLYGFTCLNRYNA